MQKVKYSQDSGMVYNLETIVTRILHVLGKFLVGYSFFVMIYLFFLGVTDLKTLSLSELKGYSVLQPYLLEFKAFRNVGYLIGVVFWVGGGLATLVYKSQPLQQSLTRVVVGVILLTFSYALAGLALDVVMIFKLLAIKL